MWIVIKKTYVPQWLYKEEMYFFYSGSQRWYIIPSSKKALALCLIYFAIIISMVNNSLASDYPSLLLFSQFCQAAFSLSSTRQYVVVFVDPSVSPDMLRGLVSLSTTHLVCGAVLRRMIVLRKLCTFFQPSSLF